MGFNDLARDVQSHAHPAVLPRRDSPLKAAKDTLLVLLSNANPLVFHGQVRVRTLGGDCHSYGATMSIFHRIGEQIRNDLLDARRVPVALDRSGSPQPHLAARLGQLILELPDLAPA